MSLNEKQTLAFQTASGGSGVQAAYELFSYGLIALVFAWAAWIALSAYKAWASGQLLAGKAGAAYVRSLLLILVLIAFFGT